MDVTHQLDAAWLDLTRSSRGRRALQRWSTEQPALAEVRRLEDLCVAVRPDRRPLMRALVELAPDDDVAGQALLQMLLPSLRAVARSLPHPYEEINELVSIAWTLIVDYPLHRQGSVLANIILDTRKRFISEARPDLMPCAARCIALDRTDQTEDRVLDLLEAESGLRAAAAARVSKVALRSVVRTRFLGEPLNQVAAAEGMTVSALTQRRLRAERWLQAHSAA